MKKGIQFVICPQCGSAIDIEEILKHISQHFASKASKGEQEKSSGA